MTPTLQIWLVLGGITFLAVLIYWLVATIKQRMIAYQLALLAEDIHAVGLATLIKEPIRCTVCKNASHVHVWQYGEKDAINEVLLCYLCASRIAKHFETSSQLKGGTPRYVRHH